MIEVKGYADEGWGPVVDAFRCNFENGELGAACCLYAGGNPVVDVWGGVADRRTARPWVQDTVVIVFSTTKGATAICAHMLAERGQLDLDASVATYWPEFAQAGKAGTLTRWLLSHQAGLPGIDVPLTLEEACTWTPVIRALERQRPRWEPGERQAYHALTYGFLVGEVVRRIAGKSIGAFFATEVAAPLDLSAWIGLPWREESRVASLASDPDPVDMDVTLGRMLNKVSTAGIAVPERAEAMLKEMWSRSDPAVRLGGAFPEDAASESGACNTRLVRGSEHPGSGMISDARSLARMYAATISEVEGVRLLQPATVERMCLVQTAPPYGVPAELEEFMIEAFPANLSLGFARPTPVQPLLGPSSFGHPGAGGSLAFADPDHNIGFGYVVNHMAPDGAFADKLVASVARCLG